VDVKGKEALLRLKLRSDNVQGQIHEHIFAPTGYYPPNIFRSARAPLKIGEYLSDTPSFRPPLHYAKENDSVFTQMSSAVFRPDYGEEI